MAIYDDQKERVSNSDLNKITGIDEKAEAKMERAGKAGARQDLANRENQGLYNPSDSSASQNGASQGREKLTGTDKDSDDSGSFASRAMNKIGGINRKKAAVGGGLSTFVAAAAFLFFTVASGPFQAIHAGQLLAGFHFGAQDSFSDNVASKFLIYALAGKAAKGRLGVIQNHNADKWEKRLNEKSGLKSVYSPGTQRLIGYQVIDSNKAGNLLDDLRSDGVPTTNRMTGVDINGTPFSAVGTIVDIRDDKFKDRRSVTRTAVRSIGVNKVSSYLGSRLLIKRGGVNFHVLNNVKRKADQKVADYNKARQEARAIQNETGSLDPNAPDAPESPTKTRLTEILDRLKVFANTAKGPALAVVGGCAVKSFGESIDTQNLANQQTAMRMGMEGVTIGAQTQSNTGFDGEEVGAFVDQLYDEKTQTSWVDDPGVQTESGEQGTGKDYLADNKPGSLEAPLVFQIADKIPDLGACDLIASIGNLGPIQFISDQATGVVDFILKPTGKTSAEYMQMAIDYFTKGSVNALAQGAERGGLMNIGVRLAANNQFIANGGTKLKPAEAQAVKAAVRAEQKAEFNKLSAYDKYANIYVSQSVAATMLARMPTSVPQTVAMITKLPATLGNAALQMTGLGTVSAQKTAAAYDYGFPLYGYTLEEQANTAYENPYANEEYILEGDRLERMNTEYGNDCFFMQISRDGNLIYGESGDPNKIPGKCDDKSNTELTRYRFYMAQLVNGLALDCYEGDEASCTQLGFGGGTADAPGAIVSGDTSAMRCDAGTDKGVADGYTDGKLVKIRICDVQGTVVNAQIAVNLDRLFTAAKGSGLRIGGGGFRTAEEQHNARVANGCPDDTSPSSSCNVPTAPVGYSNHQMGLAVDFTCGSGAFSFGGSSCHNWMVSNAKTYSLINLPSEPWHWSVDGK